MISATGVQSTDNSVKILPDDGNHVDNEELPKSLVILLHIIRERNHVDDEDLQNFQKALTQKYNGRCYFQ